MSAKAEVRRLTASLEVVQRYLTEDGYSEDKIAFALHHVKAALAGSSKPLALANAENDRLRAMLRESLREQTALRTVVRDCHADG